MKILFLDDDYNLIAETWAEDHEVNINHIDPHDSENDFFLLHNPKPLFKTYEYFLRIKLQGPPFDDWVYRMYHPAKSVSHGL